MGDERPYRLSKFAARHGLQYSEDDPFGIPDTSFFLFAAGQKYVVGSCSNVLWGDWKGLWMTAADYSFFGAAVSTPSFSMGGY